MQVLVTCFGITTIASTLQMAAGCQHLCNRIRNRQHSHRLTERVDTPNLRGCAVPWSEYVTEYVRIFQPAWIKIISDKVKALWDAGWNTLYLCHLCDSVHLTERPISQLPFTTLRRCREVWLTKRGREVPGRQFAENIWKLKTLLGWRMDHQWSATSGLHFASPSHAGMCWAKSLTSLAINAVSCARLCRLQHHQFYAIGHGEIQVSEPGGDRKN
jgi:hypothetical protein